MYIYQYHLTSHSILKLRIAESLSAPLRWRWTGWAGEASWGCCARRIPQSSHQAAPVSQMEQIKSNTIDGSSKVLCSLEVQHQMLQRYDQAHVISIASEVQN